MLNYLNVTSIWVPKVQIELNAWFDYNTKSWQHNVGVFVHHKFHNSLNNCRTFLINLHFLCVLKTIRRVI